MSGKEKMNKIQISKILIISFILVVATFLVLVFAFSKAGAPAPTSSPAISTKPVTTVAESDYVLEIDKINLSAPMLVNIDGNDKEAYNKALEGGIAHLQGSALPGKAGNPFVFGHSSYYAWKPGEYKEIFKNLNNVEAGDTVTIRSNLSIYNYKVSDKQVVNPNEVAVANQNYNEKKLTLMTCWPIGSDAKRLVIVSMLQETLPIK